MKEITITCCEGNERYRGYCIKDRCPIYVKAMDNVHSSWDAYGYPDHRNYLSQARATKAAEQDALKNIIILSLEKKPRGRKRRRSSIVLAQIPFSSGEHTLEDGSVIKANLMKNNNKAKVELKAEGPLVENPFLQVLKEGVEINLSPRTSEKITLSGTKKLSIQMGISGDLIS